MQVIKKWLNKQNYDLTATLMFNIVYNFNYDPNLWNKIWISL